MDSEAPGYALLVQFNKATVIVGGGDGRLACSPSSMLLTRSPSRTTSAWDRATWERGAWAGRMLGWCCWTPASLVEPPSTLEEEEAAEGWGVTTCVVSLTVTAL